MSTRQQRERARTDGEGRPEPDEVVLDEEATGPQPEHGEPTLRDPRLRDLSFADYRAVVVRAVKEFLADNGTMLASALAYSSFFAIPSVLLVAVGVFTLLAGPGTITALMGHFQAVVPAKATSLLGGSLHRLDANPSTSVAMTAVGGVLALWSTTGAMGAYMTAINIAYDRKDRRSFLRKRLVALEMVAAIGFAFLLVAVLLMFGPQVEKLVAAHVGVAGTAVAWIWWIAQWPILLVGLLAAFATLLYLGPDAEQPRWRFLTPGSVFAVLVWLAASGAFAVYTGMFGSYNKTWGSLAAVIVMLTWLWLAGIALLLGAEINAEVERSRELRAGEPAARELRLPHDD
ncbi:MAG TPA: YihY/virulence factor BrkB family protein [Gaiellaceae bacterium]|nr:YihY/virulence factor BrkB family protein [Gaiellaceae bacterium]